MIIKENEFLSKFTTVKVGGIAKKIYYPESIKDLSKLYEEKKLDYILGAGSNLLINDNKIFESVVHTEKLNQEIIDKGDGIFYVGCSVRLQQMINFVNNKNYGGLEKLYAIPGFVGGSVVMNAGLGKKSKLNISDFIEYVEVFKDGKVIILNKQDCNFNYRTSIFKNSNMVIVGVCFKFNKIDKNRSEMIKKERIEFIKNVQDHSGSNFGSLYYSCNRLAMEILKYTHFGYKKGFSYSRKKYNWIINKGNGTFKQAMKLIQIGNLLNKIFFSHAELEVIIWE